MFTYRMITNGAFSWPRLMDTRVHTHNALCVATIRYKSKNYCPFRAAVAAGGGLYWP